MCKRHAYRRGTLALATEGAYEGKTVRLGARQTEWQAASSSGERRRRQRGGGFPWWTLWLLWPLGAALKHAPPLATLGAVPSLAAALTAGILLVVGLWLLLRP
jgi:hypothetical protein